MERGGAETIVYYHHAAGIGGAEMSLAELLAALNGERFYPVAALGKEGNLAEELRSRGIEVHLVPSPPPRRPGLSPVAWLRLLSGLARTSFAVRELASASGAHIIHANTFYGALCCAAEPGGFEAGMRLVWSARDFVKLPKPAAVLLEKRTARVAAVSEAVAKFLVAEQGFPPEKVTTVLNGVDMERFRSPAPGKRRAARMSLGLPPEIPLVLSVGGPVGWKRHDLFLAAMRRLAEITESRKRNSGFSCALVGVSPEEAGEKLEPDIRETAEFLGVRGIRLLVPGIIEKIEEWYAAADVLVSFSENEPFGRTIIEAFACGTVVASTSGGGKSEILRDGENALVIPSEPAAAADIIAGLLESESLRERLTQVSINDARERFDVKRTAAEMEKIYAELMDLRD